MLLSLFYCDEDPDSPPQFPVVVRGVTVAIGAYDTFAATLAMSAALGVEIDFTLTYSQYV